MNAHPDIIHVLSVEDNPADAGLIRELLIEATQLGWDMPRFEIAHVSRLRAALAHLNTAEPVDVILTDLDLPDSRSDATFITLRDHAPTLPIVVFTSRDDVELARQTVRAGAEDYLYKREMNGSLLAHTLIYAIERQQIHNALEERVAERTAALEESKRALQQERDRAQRYLDIAPSIILALDTQGRITLLNKMGADILACDQDAALGKNWFETFLPERVKDETKAGFAQLMTGISQAADDGENVVLTGAGREKIIAWHHILLKNEAGEIIGLLSSGEDVTERRRAEAALAARAQALQESEARFRMAVTHSKIIFAQTDRELRYTWLANPHPDFDPQTAIGKRDDELADNEGIRQLMRMKQQVIETGQKLRMDIDFPVSDSLRTYDVIAEPLHDERGEVVGVATCALDVTERKEMEKALQKTHRQFKGFFDHSPRLVSIFDQEGRYQMVNPATTRVLGLSQEEMVGKTFTELLPAEAANTFMGRVKQLIASQRALTVSDQFPVDGQIRHFETVLFPLSQDEDGHAIFGAMASDVTERKEAERALERYAAELRRSNEEAHLD